MIAALIIPLFIGVVVGIKVIFAVEILCIGAVFVICSMIANNRGLEGIYYILVAIVFTVGVIAGDIYVFIAFPEIRGMYPNRILGVLKWLFTP